MDSRSAITSNGDNEAPQPLIAHPASKELKNPLAQPDPVGQNGYNHFCFSFSFRRSNETINAENLIIKIKINILTNTERMIINKIYLYTFIIHIFELLKFSFLNYV